MRALLPALALLLPPAAFSQEENTAVLTLVDEAGFNAMTVNLGTALGDSSDTSDLTGTINVRLNINPDTHQTSELTLVSADVSGSDITLAAGNALSNYSFTSEGIKLNGSTPNPPAAVTPATGEFDASQYLFTVDEGTLAGNIFILFVLDEDTSFDFSETPITGAGTGIGVVTLTPTTRTETRQNYDVVAIIPVSLMQSIDDIGGTGQSADTEFTGTVKAVGSTFVELLDYPTWAIAQGLPEDTPEKFDLSTGIPNYLLYSLGFDSTSAPDQLLRHTPAGVSLNIGPETIQDDLIIQWSEDFETWDRIPDANMVEGSSLIQKRSNPGSVIAGFGGATKRYYRVIKAPEA